MQGTTDERDATAPGDPDHPDYPDTEQRTANTADSEHHRSRHEAS